MTKNTIHAGETPRADMPRPLSELEAAALIIEKLGAELYSHAPGDLGACALDYAANGWEVFPLSAGKLPYKGSHGVLDATSKPSWVAAMWSGIPQLTKEGKSWQASPSSNIAGRIPEGLVVLDIDPRSGGLDTFDKLLELCGAADLATLTTLSGRGDGGQHRYYFAPEGKLSQARLNKWAEGLGVGSQNKAGGWISGIDLKTRGGYCLLPPSIHPKTGQPYRFQDPGAEIGAGSPALWEVLLEAEQLTPAPYKPQAASDRESPADYFTRVTLWGAILEGWQLVNGDGESNDSKWKAPQAEHSFSATIREGVLFNYSHSVAEFAEYVTEGGNARGVTKFRAYALLKFHGDLKAAARAVRPESAEVVKHRAAILSTKQSPARLVTL